MSAIQRVRDGEPGCPGPGGSIVALATPFRNGEIDLQALTRLCERQVERGTTALVACGSTGEAAAMQPKEWSATLCRAIEVAAGRIPVIAGCGAPSTEAATGLATLAARHGAAALLCAPPPYVRPTQEGITAHMRAISRAAGLPVLIYDVPHRTGVRVEDDTVARLFELGLVVGIKDATADLARPTRLRALCGPDLVQLGGDDATAAAHRASGGHGCISVAANLVPALCALLHRSWDHGDLAAFARTRDLLAPLSDALSVESNPIPLKAALAMLDLASGELRLPLTKAGRGTSDRLARVLADLMSAEDAMAARSRHALVG